MDELFRWLASNPAAANVFIIAFVAVIVLIVVTYLLAFREGREISLWPPQIGSKPPQSPQESETSEYREENHKIALITAESIDELRQKNGVRQLLPLENDLRLSRLPNGVYGYTVPWQIEQLKSDDKVSRECGGTSVVEVHKSVEGHIFLLGFVSQTDLIALQDPSRKTQTDIIVFFSKYSEFDKLVAIPVERIVFLDHRDIESIHVCEVTVL
jgi:hypothetical protein